VSEIDWGWYEEVTSVLDVAKTREGKILEMCRKIESMMGDIAREVARKLGVSENDVVVGDAEGSYIVVPPSISVKLGYAYGPPLLEKIYRVNDVALFVDIDVWSNPPWHYWLRATPFVEIDCDRNCDRIEVVQFIVGDEYNVSVFEATRGRKGVAVSRLENNMWQRVFVIDWSMYEDRPIIDGSLDPDLARMILSATSRAKSFISTMVWNDVERIIREEISYLLVAVVGGRLLP